jgi:hypothetical protein
MTKERTFEEKVDKMIDEFSKNPYFSGFKEKPMTVTRFEEAPNIASVNVYLEPSFEGICMNNISLLAEAYELKIFDNLFVRFVDGKICLEFALVEQRTPQPNKKIQFNKEREFKW